MTDEGRTPSHLSVAMTTAGITHATDENTVRFVHWSTDANTVKSPSARGIEFYFQIAVLMIGVVGTAANALVLYALVASKQHKKQMLIVHQNVLDIFTSFFMIVTYIIQLCNMRLAGSVGYWLCTMILSNCLSWWGTGASAINLAFITVERYLKVVHPVWSKNKLGNWMVYLAISTAWVISFINNIVMVFPTSRVIDGGCYAYVFWENQTAYMINFIWNFLFYYVIILFIFVFCYWRILVVIRRQATVMAGHAASGSNAA